MSTWRRAYRNGKAIMISIKDIVHTKHGFSFYRPLNAIDSHQIEAVLGRAEAALKRPGVLPANRADEVVAVQLT
jgi:hypothetical protein